MSTSEAQNLPRVLLVHDGELADVGALLASPPLGLEVADRRGGLRPDDASEPWDLVISSSRYGVDLRLASQPPPPLIAVLDHESRTLRTSLRRAGARILVRRPVHPAALRALVLHALYRGPEKRSAPRVSVGAPVRIRTGWRGRDAVLADLSVGGCRLLVAERVERGRGFRLTLPPEVSGLKKAFTLRARALEMAPAADAGSRERPLTARFERLDPRQIARLQATVERHAAGPARCPGAPALQPGAANESERREGERRAIDGRVVALEAEAARVLLGRDLSLGGMRVDPNPHLAVGMELDLAAHLPECAEPVRLRARVERDDGERGMLLRFDESDAQQREALESLLDALLVVGVESGGGAEADEDFALELADQPVLVTEIVAMA